MLGPYSANVDGTISYNGNRIFPPLADVRNAAFSEQDAERIPASLKENNMWGSIARINDRITQATMNYFAERRALFTLLPLTTRMISSPGAVYGREAINYTTDTCPITLDWFDLPRTAFLSESSQIYLELALLPKDVNDVFAIYNSFRKERADATHLSEFHHIEYEGKIDQKVNESVALGLMQRMITDVIQYNSADLARFISDSKISQWEAFAHRINNAPRITFAEALSTLKSETGKEKYDHFTLDGFGSWEEVKLTQIYGNLVAIREFPLLEVPFYHAAVDGKNPKVANNTDFIMPGYRETIGSGHRVRTESELESKANIFNLPREDYMPYLQSRSLDGYVETSGFGLGLERFIQGFLEMPYIWSASQFPRTHATLKP